MSRKRVRGGGAAAGGGVAPWRAHMALAGEKGVSAPLQLHVANRSTPASTPTQHTPEAPALE